MNDLIDVQPLIDIISLSLQSSFISNEKNGVSILLIARPETAKTSSIFKFQNLDFISYYDEVTQKKLLDEFLPLCRQRQKRTLLIPDLVNCIEKQKSTRDQFLNIMKSGIDDTGIVQISTYHKQFFPLLKLFEGVKFNLITGVTINNFRSVEKQFKDSGLLSRLIPFSYDYPMDKVRKIYDYIEGGKLENNTTAIRKINKKDVEVPKDSDLFKNFEFASTKLGLQYGGFGLRAQINFQRLAMASALLEGRRKVNKGDIDRVLKLSNWINFDFNSL